MRTAVVTGDITIDWMLAKPYDPVAPPPHWTSEVTAAAFRQAGGAALLAELVRRDAERLATGGPEWRILVPKLTTERLRESEIPADDERHDHAFSIWQPFPRVLGAHDLRWRVSEFQGYDNREHRGIGDSRVEDDVVDADLVVLIDAGLGFRTARESWPKAITDPDADPRRVILRLTYAKPDGPLWDHVVERWADRLVVVTSIRDLRSMSAHISEKLSWERTAREAAYELRHREGITEFGHSASTVIAIGQSGGLLVSGMPTDRPPLLIFDPGSMEGEWESDFPGGVLGVSSCMTAGLVHEFLKHPDEPDLAAGIKLGVVAQRRLQELGYGESNSGLPRTLDPPFEDIVDALHGAGEGQGSLDQCDLADVEVDLRERAGEGLERGLVVRDWTILESKHPADTLCDVAERIVRDGVEAALGGVPVLKFNKLVTVDRHEIEAVRTIERLINESCRRRDNAPLCIGVFGPPGSGKSFAVKQVARHSQPGRIEPIEFNLSQFERPADLFEAFHQVRDVNLRGKIPLAVWDEFDTALDGPLGWLRYFLEPMQDGEFQQGEITHPIGQCIFVFAGGTADRMADFPNKEIPEEQVRAAKVPDFVSRLHGYMDVLGPNRHTSKSHDDPGWEKDDPYFIIRRAVVLRSIFESDDLHVLHGAKVEIDPGVLHAFLNAERYHHGIRSISSIVRMSLLASAKTFEASSLPPREQLKLHVSDEFLDLI